MFLRSIVKAVIVAYFFTTLALTVEGENVQKMPVNLHALYFVQVLTAKKVTGLSKVYTIETVDITNTTRNESILQLSFLKHQLLPGDRLTFYDGNYTRVLREFNASSATPALPFFTTLPDAKVVFTANTSDLMTERSYIFLYRTVPKGTDQECNRLFFGRRGNIDSSTHDRGSKSCKYTITLTGFLGAGSMSLLFNDLIIPVGESLVIWQSSEYNLQPEGQPVKVFTHANNGQQLHYIGSRKATSLVLEFNSTTQFKIRFQEYDRVIDVVGKSGEITLPLEPYPEYLKLKYWITVPRGYVKLTIHDLYLPKYRSNIEVYRFNGRKQELLRTFGNSTKLDTSTVVSDSNRLAVSYYTHKANSTGRFRITYSMLETAPKTCSSFPNLKKSKLFAELYEGWEDTYSCKSGYGNTKFGNDDEVSILCQSNGSWIYTNGRECRKECAPLESLYDLSSHGLSSFNLDRRYLSGENVTVFCKSLSHRQSHDHEITCLSSGEYSARLPYCKERPSGSRLLLALVLPLCFAFVFFVVVVGYCVLRYASCVSTELRVKLFGPNVVASQHRPVELQENSPLHGSSAAESNIARSAGLHSNTVENC